MLPTHRPPTHPGEMLLKEFLEPLRVSQVEAATRMSIPFQRLNAIVKGRRAVSADTALLLEALTGWEAQIWLTLQARWDLWHAMKARGHRPEGSTAAQKRIANRRSRCTNERRRTSSPPLSLSWPNTCVCSRLCEASVDASCTSSGARATHHAIMLAAPEDVEARVRWHNEGPCGYTVSN